MGKRRVLPLPLWERPLPRNKCGVNSAAGEGCFSNNLILKSVLIFKKHTIYILLKYAFHKITPHPPPNGVGLSHKGRGKSSLGVFIQQRPLWERQYSSLSHLFNNEIIG
jgi:hypothetical protein